MNEFWTLIWTGDNMQEIVFEVEALPCYPNVGEHIDYEGNRYTVDSRSWRFETIGTRDCMILNLFCKKRKIT